MREILFRGKRADNGEWVYGDLMHKHYNFDTKATKVIHDNIMKYKVIPETVGQYTGLTDKNGKKILEGDIVKVPIEYDCGCYPHTEIEKKVVEIPGIYRLRVDGEPEVR